MAAPQTAYQTVMIPFSKGAADGTIAETRNCYLAKFLVNTSTDSGDGYFNSSDSDAVKVQKIKDLFHIDGWEMYASGSGVFGFIGFVLQGSANAAFHKYTRFSGTTIPNGALEGTLIAERLNDAGLNCKPHKPAFQVQGSVATKINVLDNSVLLRAVFNSAFYNATTSHTLNVAKSTNLNVVVSAQLGTLAAKVQRIYTGDIVVIPAGMIFYVGQSYVLSLSASNDEGESSSDTLSLSPSPAAVNLKYGSTLDAAIASSAASTVYINRRISDAVAGDGVIFFSNIDANAFVQSAYYVSIEANELGRYKYYRVTGTSGNVTEINEIVSRHQDVYYYYSSVSEADALTHAPVEIVLYYKTEITPPGSDFENRTYYAGTFADSAFASAGYYVKSDRTTGIQVEANGYAQVLIP